MRIEDFELRVEGSELWVEDLGSRVSGFGFRVSGFGFWVSVFGFRFSGCGSRVSVAEVCITWVTRFMPRSFMPFERETNVFSNSISAMYSCRHTRDSHL